MLDPSDMTKPLPPLAQLTGVQSKTDMVIDSTFTVHYSLFTAFIESFECTGVSALADIEAHSMLARGS